MTIDAKQYPVILNLRPETEMETGAQQTISYTFILNWMMAYFERQHFCNFVVLDRKRTDMSIYHYDECYDFNCYAGTYHTDSITYFFSIALSLSEIDNICICRCNF